MSTAGKGSTMASGMKLSRYLIHEWVSRDLTEGEHEEIDRQVEVMVRRDLVMVGFYLGKGLDELSTTLIRVEGPTETLSIADDVRYTKLHAAYVVHLPDCPRWLGEDNPRIEDLARRELWETTTR